MNHHVENMKEITTYKVWKSDDLKYSKILWTLALNFYKNINNLSSTGNYVWRNFQIP